MRGTDFFLQGGFIKENRGREKGYMGGIFFALGGRSS